MWCAADNRNYMCHIMCKTIFRYELYLSNYWQNIKFSQNCAKFHMSQKIVFLFKYNWKLIDQLLLLYQFYGRDMWGMHCFHFCQLWAVKWYYLSNYSVLPNSYLPQPIDMYIHFRSRSIPYTTTIMRKRCKASTAVQANMLMNASNSSMVTARQICWKEMIF